MTIRIFRANYNDAIFLILYEDLVYMNIKFVRNHFWVFPNDEKKKIPKDYKEITQEYIENFQYNEILKSLQEYLNEN